MEQEPAHSGAQQLLTPCKDGSCHNEDSLRLLAIILRYLTATSLSRYTRYKLQVLQRGSS